jgi:hypothetical protein
MESPNAFALLFLALLSGCSVLPKQVVIRDPAGSTLATANTSTGDITLTHLGLHYLQPKIILPGRKK